MPQTSAEIQERIDKFFPSASQSQDFQSTKFLEKAGYILNKNWTWKLPSPDHKITEEEDLCLVYLIEEWDFGGIENAT